MSRVVRMHAHCLVARVDEPLAIGLTARAARVVDQTGGRRVALGCIDGDVVGGTGRDQSQARLDGSPAVARAILRMGSKCTCC